MKQGTAIITGMVCLILSACSPQVYFDSNPSVNIASLRTYAFLPKVDSAKVSVYNSDIIDDLIHKSIVAQMNSRNFTVDTKKPDLLIKFHMMVEKKEDIVNTSPYTYPSYMYRFPMRYPYYYYPGPMYMPNSFSRIEYKEGTLIIDFFDHASGKMAWRGWGTRNIDNLTKFEQTLPDLIDEILANYPVHRKEK